jgi:hypothetical protein
MLPRMHLPRRQNNGSSYRNYILLTPTIGTDNQHIDRSACPHFVQAPFLLPVHIGAQVNNVILFPRNMACSR